MHSKFLGLTLVVCAVTLCAPAGADDAKLRNYGKHLAEECASCHRERGANPGIVPVEDWDVDRFIETMRAYQSGERPNPTMVSVAKSLDEEQLHALALYYASLRKPQAPRAGGDVAKPQPNAPTPRQ